MNEDDMKKLAVQINDAAYTENNDMAIARMLTGIACQFNRDYINKWIDENTVLTNDDLTRILEKYMEANVWKHVA